MSSGLLAPKRGWWYLGEQCGLDMYQNIRTGKIRTKSAIRRKTKPRNHTQWRKA